jgi:hypothetical protein
MIRYIREAKDPGDEVWAKYTEDELRAIAFSSVYSEEIRQKAATELQRRVNLQTQMVTDGVANPLTSNYWWEDVNLKGYPEEYPPVIYQGEIYTSGNVCKTWSTYKGQIGCYENQLEEHKSFMRKWYTDNAPGDDFYKNNPFYIKGEDGLPVFSYDESRRNVPKGFHPQEYPLYLAEVNNIKTKYTNKKNDLSKLKDTDIERLKGWRDYYQKQYNEGLANANRIDAYQTGTGLKNSADEYDYTGGIGATMSSVSSGGVGTGNRELDSFLKNDATNLLKNIENAKKQINDRLTQFAKDSLVLDENQKTELANKKIEYYHEKFPNGITKEDYAKYLKMEKRYQEVVEGMNKLESEYRKSNKAFYFKTGGVAADATYISPQNYWTPTGMFRIGGRDIESMGMPEFSKEQIPSELEDWRDIDWEMAQIRGQAVELLSQENMSTSYINELEAAQLVFGYVEPEVKVDKPWESGFWEWGRIGENFYDWFSSFDIHDIMTCISIAVMCIPGLQGVGLAMRAFGVAEATALGLGLTEAAMLSAAVDLLDAGIYVSEGNNRMAGLSVLFALVPFALESTVVKTVFKKGSNTIKEAAKFLLACPDLLMKSYTQMTMKEIYEYTKIMLKDEVQAALKYVSTNAPEITRIMKEGTKTIIDKSKTVLNSQVVNKSVSTTLKFANGLKNVAIPLIKGGATFGGYIGMGIAYNEGIDFANSVAETPKSVVERILGKGSWEIVKGDFMSDGSITDNELLKNAVLDGWRPGIPVPLQYQTDTYKEYLKKEKNKVTAQTIEETEITEEDLKQIEVIMKSSKVTEVIVEEKVEEKKEELENVDIDEQEMQEIIDETIKLYEEGKLDEFGNIIDIENDNIDNSNQTTDKEVQKESKWIQFLIDCEIIK